MMSWNHRVMKYKDGMLAIHEVYYVDGEIELFTDDPVGILGDNIEELKETLERMLKALDTPILDREDLCKKLNCTESAED